MHTAPQERLLLGGREWNMRQDLACVQPATQDQLEPFLAGLALLTTACAHHACSVHAIAICMFANVPSHKLHGVCICVCMCVPSY